MLIKCWMWNSMVLNAQDKRKCIIIQKLKLAIVPGGCIKFQTNASALVSLIIPLHNIEHISSPAIIFITWFSKYLRAQWVNNRSKDDLHMNAVCEWEWVTEEGCLSIVGAGRFAPLCPHSKGQVRFSDTKGQVKICSAWTPETFIMMMLWGGFQEAYIKAPGWSQSTAGYHVFMDWCYMSIRLSSSDYKTMFSI